MIPALVDTLDISAAGDPARCPHTASGTEEGAMLNYTGTGRMDYEDVLRAIGHFIDEHNFKEVCIIELEEGILVRGLVYTANSQGFRTISEAYLFTNEDLDHILEAAY